MMGVIDEKNVTKQATTVIHKSLAEVEESRPTLLITSPSMSNTAAGLSGVNVAASEIVTSRAQSDHFCRPPVQVEAVIGLGGGNVMDVAKLRGWPLGAEVTCIPSILSTDAFLTAGACVRDAGRVSYVPTGCATRAVIDFGLLLDAPARLNALGCSDVLSMLTACHDWRNAPGGGSSDSAVQEATAICETLLPLARFIAGGSPSGLAGILQALEDEVDLCSRYATDRIEEGGEHFFAYALEQHLPRLMHGALVGLGILAVRYLQGYPIEDLRRFYAVTGVARAWSGVAAAVLVETFQEMPFFVEAGGYPHSVWSTTRLSEGAAAELARSVLAEGTA